MPSKSRRGKVRTEDAWCAWHDDLGWLWYTVSSRRETTMREMEENTMGGKVLRVRITEVKRPTKKGASKR